MRKEEGKIRKKKGEGREPDERKRRQEGKKARKEAKKHARPHSSRVLTPSMRRSFYPSCYILRVCNLLPTISNSIASFNASLSFSSSTT